jgi:imidazolonepropionase
LENLRDARGAMEIPVHGRVVMPGFVDNGLRAFVPSRPRRSFTQIRVDVSTLLRDCLQHGTTSAELETGGSEDPADDLPLLRHALKVGTEDDVVHAWRLHLPDGQADASWFKLLAEHFDYVVKHRQARFVKLDPGGASLGAFLLVLRMAHSAGLRLKLRAREDIGDEFLALAAEHGLVSVAGFSLNPGGNLDIIARSQSAAVFRPLLDLAHPVAEQNVLTNFLKAGGAPVLASGNDEESPGYSMQAAVELAVFRHGMNLDQALTAATINAAYAAGCGHDRGSLEVGKRADILVLNISDYRDIPRQLGINYVGMVIRRGVVVFNRTSWSAAGAGR